MSSFSSTAINLILILFVFYSNLFDFLLLFMNSVFTSRFLALPSFSFSTHYIVTGTIIIIIIIIRFYSLFFSSTSLLISSFSYIFCQEELNVFLCLSDQSCHFFSSHSFFITSLFTNNPRPIFSHNLHATPYNKLTQTRKWRSIFLFV